MDESLEHTLPYGTWRPAALRALIGLEDSFSSLFVNPPVNPPNAVAGSPAVRTPGRRRAMSTALSLASGPPLPPGSALPEGTDMPRTPERAPRHAPDVRIGCDIHPVAETAASIERFGDRYLHRIFTDHELAQCAGDVERLTGRFAAKEAVLKVLQPQPDDAVPLKTIEVRSSTSGAPFVSLSGPASALAARNGIDRIDISVSHDAGLGMAVAAAIRGMDVAS
jgi:holo-[acyl-carrier protein] synthase